MRVTGKVVRFDGVRGYGFITPDRGGDDVFLHANDLEMEKHLAKRGASVSFEIEEGDRGQFATHVKWAAKPARTRPTPSDGDYEGADDDYFDVLTSEEFLHIVTERLLQITPALTAQQILAVRSSFEEFARKYGLVDP